jgi:hypothetical protein
MNLLEAEPGLCDVKFTIEIRGHSSSLKPRIRADVLAGAAADPGAEGGPQSGRVGASRVRSLPWGIRPISIHGGTCGATRARRVIAAAVSAVSASPGRVGCGREAGQDVASMIVNSSKPAANCAATP